MKLALSVVVVAACTGPDKSIQMLADTTRPFTPSHVELSRTPANCADQTSPFSTDDSFVLSLQGTRSATNLPTTIAVTFHTSLPLGQSLPVDLEDPVVVAMNGSTELLGQHGTLPFENNSFDWEQGPDPSEIDAAPLANAVVRMEAEPDAEGDLGAMTIRMAFADDGVYDVQVAATAHTPPSGCAGAGDNR